MSSTVRLSRRAAQGALMAVLAAAGLGGLLTWAAQRVPTPPSGRGAPGAAAPSWPSPVSFAQVDWNVFRSGTSTVSGVKGGAPAVKFRLAGIFSWALDSGTGSVRKAILHVPATQEEHIVKAGDRVDAAEVLQVDEQSVLIRDGGKEETLTLAYASLGAGGAGAARTKTDAADSSGRPVATTAYGVQLGPTRWSMNRQPLVKYMQEMIDNPTRMSKLFDSMVPIYDAPGPDGRRRVSGYKLQVAGEGDFYRAVGLQEGDEVYRVNDVPVTSKQRAMFWIEQFRDNKETAFALDIRRGGRAVRLDYTVK